MSVSHGVIIWRQRHRRRGGRRQPSLSAAVSRDRHRLKLLVAWEAANRLCGACLTPSRGAPLLLHLMAPPEGLPSCQQGQRRTILGTPLCFSVHSNSLSLCWNANQHYLLWIFFADWGRIWRICQQCCCFTQIQQLFQCLMLPLQSSSSF